MPHPPLNIPPRQLLASLCLVVAASCMFVPGQQRDSFTTPVPLRADDVLIIGFQGGRDDWDDDTKSVRRLALALQERELPGVWIENVENKERQLAVELIRSCLDRDRNGVLERGEREAARLIIYGQSFGGAAVVKLARDLDELGVPIALTIQIDSIGKGDGKIPPNVARAANLFQQNGWFVKGESWIHAENPIHTWIIGNFQYDYSDSDISLEGVPWYKKLFRAAHARMDRDPEVWAHVERLVLEQLERWSID